MSTKNGKSKDTKLLSEIVKKAREGQSLSDDEFQLVLERATKDIHAFVKAKKKGDKRSPLDYATEQLLINKSSLNSYFFMSYGVFQKDLKEKVKPYVAFTIALLHALNIGCELGKLQGGGDDEPNTTDSGDRKSGKARTNRNRKASRKRK